MAILTADKTYRQKVLAYSKVADGSTSRTAACFPAISPVQIHLGNPFELLSIISRRGRRKLTVQVERHRRGNWLRHIVVGRLARQHPMQIAPLQPLQVQHILHPFIRHHDRVALQHGGVVHPRHVRQRRACRCFCGAAAAEGLE